LTSASSVESRRASENHSWLAIFLTEARALAGAMPACQHSFCKRYKAEVVSGKDKSPRCHQRWRQDFRLFCKNGQLSGAAVLVTKFLLDAIEHTRRFGTPNALLWLRRRTSFEPGSRPPPTLLALTPTSETYRL
jgi:hypothetical protein